MNELALFAGAGGGILGGHLLGWRTVCAVEWGKYPASVLLARQNDGILPAFPIWDDVQTFDGRPWRGIVDVVSGGFPCQDISAAGGVPESMALEAACGNTWQELSVRFDLNASSWKTAHCLWEEALPWFSVILPRWGMTRNGSVYQHQTAERPISETVSGLLPTPLASNTKANHMRSNGRPPRSYWPTPTVCGNYNRKGVSKTSGDGLATAVRTWPTPVATMSKGSSPASLTRKSGRDRSNDRLDHAVMAAEGGQLNPTWVEWLMGWPLGWTDLKPLEMGKFHEWQQQHSISCQTK